MERKRSLCDLVFYESISIRIAILGHLRVKPHTVHLTFGQDVLSHRFRV